jgi:hypothetical protein
MAIAPLEIWDEQGRSLFNFNTRVARQMGSFSTGTSDGSQYVAELADANGWMAVQFFGDYGVDSAPMINRVGGSLSWRFIPNQPSGGRVAATIFYGVR